MRPKIGLSFTHLVSRPVRRNTIAHTAEPSGLGAAAGLDASLVTPRSARLGTSFAPATRHQQQSRLQILLASPALPFAKVVQTSQRDHNGNTWTSIAHICTVTVKKDLAPGMQELTHRGEPARSYYAGLCACHSCDVHATVANIQLTYSPRNGARYRPHRADIKRSRTMSWHHASMCMTGGGGRSAWLGTTFV